MVEKETETFIEYTNPNGDPNDYMISIRKGLNHAGFYDQPFNKNLIRVPENHLPSFLYTMGDLPSNKIRLNSEQSKLAKKIIENPKMGSEEVRGILNLILFPES